ncbi:hypothetical protein MCOR14_007038 [Pyricularia oryzae]|nr:hypothetical protein MCOR13_010013 [Pyricularia oryzae]KAI6632841.1 hypothetical protein MCOR14_007038 [Pyricularia oryzae]
MASSVHADSGWLRKQVMGSSGLELLDSSRFTIGITLAALVLLPVVASYLTGARKGKEAPLVNPPGLFQLAVQKNIEFVHKGNYYLEEARRRFPNQPFKLLTNGGPMTVLPPSRSNEIKNMESLDFRKVLSYAAPVNLPGGSAIAAVDHPQAIIQTVITKNLTKRLNTVTGPLADEASFAINKNFGSNPDWVEAKICEPITDVVARLSSRVFLGEEICRNEEWVDLTKKIAIVVLTCIYTLRAFPQWMMPIVYTFGKAGKDMRAMRTRVIEIIHPIIDKREQEKAECKAQGIPAPVYNDAIEWVAAEADPNDPVFKLGDFQIGLSVAAIHTSSDLLGYTLLWLAASDPAYIDALRKEIVEVQGKKGWKKTSLVSMKLLDSTIKEAQRLKPVQLAIMQRRAMKDIEFEGGVTVRKGELVAIDSNRLRDPAYYPNPDTFDPYRFYNARKQPGGEHKAQFVSVTPDHLTFGYGKYACPGRFFAANEIKLALCHLLLKYDWKLPEKAPPKPLIIGIDPLVDPEARLLFRRRKEEIDLDSLDVENEE